jgi:hypothetical protein
MFPGILVEHGQGLDSPGMDPGVFDGQEIEQGKDSCEVKKFFPVAQQFHLL